MREYLESGIKLLDLNLPIETIDKLIKYAEELLAYNTHTNLTAIRDNEDLIEKHFIDSLIVHKKLPIREGNAIDIGTGAGFPGLPIKIAFPHIHVVLLDSLNKRIKFLNAVIEELDLADVETLHGRAEDYAKRKEYREQFDLCVSRAVANLSTLSEYCIPFVKRNGYFVSYKSGSSDEEIQQAEKAVNILGGKIEKTDKFLLPETDMGRALVNIKKIKITPAKYPRKAGMPSREPL